VGGWSGEGQGSSTSWVGVAYVRVWLCADGYSVAGSSHGGMGQA